MVVRLRGVVEQIAALRGVAWVTIRQLTVDNEPGAPKFRREGPSSLRSTDSIR
jgi:hypothetical protein